jgi:hypothetical protein
MGLFLDAACSACDYRRAGLRLGATHRQIEQHDVCTHELYRLSCCGEVQSVLIYMGQPLPELDCATCGVALDLAVTPRYRVATMKGEVLEDHPCPRCGESRLGFSRRGKFV